MGWAAAGLTTIGSLASSAMGMIGQSNLNIANRDFAASQAELNRNFQAQQQLQAENYNTQMSDTAMSRRVHDLYNAGLNPALALGGPGPASAPTMSAPGGAQANTPSTANPYSNMNLGGAVQSAIQTAQMQAQTKQIEAQTKKTISETPDDDEGHPPEGDEANGQLPEALVASGPNHKLGNAAVTQMMASSGASQATAQQAIANINLIDAQVRSTDSNTANTNLRNYFQGQTNDVLAATKQALIQKAIAESTVARGEAATAQGPIDVMGGKYGDTITILNQLLGIAGNAVSVAHGGVSTINKAQYPTMGR